MQLMRKKPLAFYKVAKQRDNAPLKKDTLKALNTLIRIV